MYLYIRLFCTRLIRADAHRETRRHHCSHKACNVMRDGNPILVPGAISTTELLFKGIDGCLMAPPLCRNFLWFIASIHGSVGDFPAGLHLPQMTDENEQPWMCRSEEGVPDTVVSLTMVVRSVVDVSLVYIPGGDGKVATFYVCLVNIVHPHTNRGKMLLDVTRVTCLTEILESLLDVGSRQESNGHHQAYQPSDVLFSAVELFQPSSEDVTPQCLAVVEITTLDPALWHLSSDCSV